MSSIALKKLQDRTTLYDKLYDLLPMSITDIAKKLNTSRNQVITAVVHMRKRGYKILTVGDTYEKDTRL